MRDPIAVTDVNIEPRRAIGAAIATLLVIAGLVTLKPSVLWTIVVILGFFVMIMLHELGHFLTAKRTGMKVTEFFVGFGPRIWSFTRGETEYGIKALPLGGYCKIVGMTNLEDVDPTDEQRTYRSKSYPARVLVASAGSITHFLVAGVLMFSVLAFGGRVTTTTTIAAVESKQPAAAAGLQQGDRIEAIDGRAIHSWDDVHNILTTRGGQTVPFVVERDGLFKTISVKLATQNPLGDHVGYAGIQAATKHVRYSAPAAIARTPTEVWNVAHASFDALGQIFSPHGISNYVKTVAGTNSDKASENNRFISPLGFGRVANQAVNAGWVSVLGLLIAINVFVGIFNMLPLLPFDGGYVAIATYERIATSVKRRKVQVDVAKLLPLTVAVMGVLGFIFLSSLFLDITHPIQNPF